MRSMTFLLFFILALALQGQEVRAPQRGVITLTVPAGQTRTQSIEVSQRCMIGAVQVDQNWTAANLRIRTSASGDRWGYLRDDTGTAYEITIVDADDVAELPLAAILTLRYIQLESTVVQPAQRTIKLLCR